MTELLVKVKQGIVEGIVKENVEGGKCIVFQGLPYAAPPVGNLRFQDPRPPLPWTGIRNSFEREIKAAQIHARTGEIVGEDDCLYINVATNSLIGKKAVMVWIHGGAFTYSSSDLNYFGPDYLLKHDIVFVSFNFRIGIFGFLNLDIKDCSGNQGLKDQVYALKWIQENIEAFGGDKKNVTIFGGSSGSVCVHYLCISPLAKGLFHKAVCQSGVVVNSNNFQTTNKEFAYKILQVLGKKTCNPKEAVQLFRNFSAQEILQAELKLVKNIDIFFTNAPFLPTLDIVSKNPFLPRPIQILNKNGINVPLMIGFNNLDGTATNFDTTEEGIRIFYEQFEKNLESLLNLDNLIDVQKFAKQVENFYFKKNPITVKDVENILKYSGDVVIINGIQFVVENQMYKKTPTFMYEFEYKIDDSIIRRNPIYKNFQGAGHAEENFLLFYRPVLGKERQLKKGTKDYKMMQIMTKMWTNFAKTGDPSAKMDDLLNIKWKPLSASRKFYLDINNPLFLGENPAEESWKMWKPIWLLKMQKQI